ncbi:thioredoxin family protein [Mangrovibacillus sp. Mu-81]|jgi:thiol-disulfide isomerase/thioredoxin|uniref:thioredoxin family protein n=1 Tax=Mangrovibacillus sp. Mu-81 TaxID=3121478 RepID=UPI002FE436B9
MRKLETIEEFHELKNKGKHVFMFSADWCPDCRVIEPILPEIESEFSEYTFIYADRDQFIDICIENDIFGIPSFLAFGNGQELGRFVSKDRKSKEEIQEFMNNLSK